MWTAFISVADVDSLAVVKSSSSVLTCMTGIVTYEPDSGVLVYDDSHQETCSFGANQCYKRTIVATLDKWPGNLL